MKGFIKKAATRACELAKQSTVGTRRKYNEKKRITKIVILF